MTSGVSTMLKDVPTYNGENFVQWQRAFKACLTLQDLSEAAFLNKKALKDATPEVKAANVKARALVSLSMDPKLWPSSSTTTPLLQSALRPSKATLRRTARPTCSC